MQNSKNNLISKIKESKLNPQTYAVIAVDGNDVVYMFGGEGDILLELIPGLQEKIKVAIETDTLH